MACLAALLLTLAGSTPGVSGGPLLEHRSHFDVRLIEREMTRTIDGEEEPIERELPAWTWSRTRRLVIGVSGNGPNNGKAHRSTLAEQVEVRRTLRPDDDALEHRERACRQAEAAGNLQPEQDAYRVLRTLSEQEPSRLDAKVLGGLLFPGGPWQLKPCDPAMPLTGRALRHADDRSLAARRSLRGELQARCVSQPGAAEVVFEISGALRFSQGERESLQLGLAGTGFDNQKEIHRLELKGELRYARQEPGRLELKLAGLLRLERRDVRTLSSERGDIETDRRHRFEGRFELLNRWSTQ